MTQKQRPSHFACLFGTLLHELENHSCHEFTYDSLQGACLKETTALERTLIFSPSDSAGYSEPKRTPALVRY